MANVFLIGWSTCWKTWMESGDCPFTLFVAAFWQPPATRLFEVSQSSVPETNCGNAVLTSVDTRYRHLQPVSVIAVAFFHLDLESICFPILPKESKRNTNTVIPSRLPENWLKGYSRLHLYLSRNNDLCYTVTHVSPENILNPIQNQFLPTGHQFRKVVEIKPRSC